MTVLDDNTSKTNDPSAEAGAAASAAAAVTVRINLPDKAKIKKKNGASAVSAAASSSAPRRIVKATLPKPASADEAERAVAAAAASHDDEDDDEEDENKHHNNYHPDPYLRGAGLDSPLVREAVHETVQHVKQEQIRSSAGLRKIKTDLAMNERRHNQKHAAVPNGTKSAAAATSTAASASAKANPFSRFLSVFSVEPAHPEHKRGLSQAGGPEHDDDRGSPPANGGGGAGAGPHPPVVKKPRKDDDAAAKSSDAVFVGNVDAATAAAKSTSTHRSNSEDRSADQAPWYTRIRPFSNLATNHHHPSLTAVSVVAVATVAVWVAWRWSRNSSMLGSSASA
jgi:hypothetical protein